MSTPEERAINNQKVDYVQQVAAGEDRSALTYLQLIARCARIADDVKDQPESLSQLDLLTIIEILFVRLPSNSFYIQHQQALLSQHITIWNTWEASNVLAEGDQTDKIYAHVLRDYVNELLPLVALLTQGHDKMKEVNGLIRSLFKKELGE
jgi:hypothetical protein